MHLSSAAATVVVVAVVVVITFKQYVASERIDGDI